MNWGKSYPKVSLNDVPSRERHEVKTFDVRKYVDEKVKKNKDNLLDFGGGMGSLPFFPSSPSSNPFMPPSGIPSSKPISSSASNPTPFAKPEPKKDPFDVDDIVKKIDEKIAQLEKEEAEAKKKEQELSSPLENTTVIPTLKSETNKDINMNDVLASPKTQQENNNNLNELINGKKKLDTDIPEDDNFFDDFFDE